MNPEKLIRFAFASKKRKIMTLCIGAAAAVGSLAGVGGDKEPAKKTSAGQVTSTTTTAGAVPAAAVTVSFANCDEVRAAGKAPIRKGDPGYSSKLDRDGDGVACAG